VLTAYNHAAKYLSVKLHKALITMICLTLKNHLYDNTTSTVELFRLAHCEKTNDIDMKSAI